MFEILSSPEWSVILRALPFPAAMLDGELHYVLLNPASVSDPILSRGAIGVKDLDARVENGMFDRAHSRHAHYEESLRRHEPLRFDEQPIAGRRTSTAAMSWLCLPVSVDVNGNTGRGKSVERVGVGSLSRSPRTDCQAKSDEIPTLDKRLVVVGLDLSTTESAPIAAERSVSAREINRALRLPLITVVAVAGTLMGALSGADHRRADLIEKSGRRLLVQLDELTGNARARDGNGNRG